MMKLIPVIYHPPKDSEIFEKFGDDIPGELVRIIGNRFHVRIPIEVSTDQESHTMLVVCEHDRVTIAGQ